MTRSIMRNLILGMMLLAVVGSACVAPALSDELPDPPSWQGLVPGVSIQEDVLAVLGEPDEILREIGQTAPVSLSEPNAVWSYWDAPRKSQSSLWFVISFEEGVVYYIEVAWTDSKSAEVRTLEELVTQYGKPYYVTWGDNRTGRWLAWPRDGVLAAAFASPELSRAWVSTIVYTIPMTEQEFDEGPWPIVWPNEQWGLSDGKPKDPFDWSGISEP